jgi:MinD superfamily P-loop ATPase
MKKILVLSGKGGTGKTTITSTLIDLLDIKAFADCDIDAPNLHLIEVPKKTAKKKPFRGMDIARIDPDKCNGCGKCFSACRFDSIIHEENGKFRVNELACEGCFVCQLVCPENAITALENVVGTTQVFKDDKIFSTAILHMGSGNSGKLVSEVKKNLYENVENQDLAIIDGSPGIGCPVIASLSGIDLAIMVTEPTLSGLSDLRRIVKTARTFKTPVAIIINKSDLNDVIAKDIVEYAKKEDIPFLGNIPYDKQVSVAINKNISLAKLDCPASLAILEIKDKITKLI